MKNEISLSKLWKVFAKCWALILAFVIVAMLVTGLFTVYVMEEKYSSTVTFYVINVSPDTEYVTTSLMQVVEHLSNDYIQIIGSEVMLTPLCETLLSDYGIDYTPEQIRSMMKSSVTADASTFSLRITNTDRNHAYVIAQLIANEAPEIVRTFTSIKTTDKLLEETESDDLSAMADMEKIRVLNNPKLDTSADSPNLTKNLVIAAMASGLFVYLICFIRSFFNTIITTEDDFSAITAKYPILGTIPRWE